jgi:hypothetical protein
LSGLSIITPQARTWGDETEREVYRLHEQREKTKKNIVYRSYVCEREAEGKLHTGVSHNTQQRELQLLYLKIF